jgi:aspartyl-tRNA(Asn)/glutamyl-tRNA(Gln) amidotransferase subunit C
MPDVIDKSDVERVAALARLRLTPEEVELFSSQLTSILEYARQVQEIDTSGVPPTSHVLGNRPMERPDEVRPSLSTDDALSNAPGADRSAGLFVVPRVVG